MSKRRRARRTYAELLRDKLTELSDGKQQFVSNKALREALGWDEARYTRIRKELVGQNLLIVGRGFGGSVALNSVPGAIALTVFVSYSHVDETYKNELVKHLEPLRRSKLIETWHDRKIKAGDTWDEQISGNISKANIILLLVSIDFINSRYCYEVELEQALERHANDSVKVIPVILRPCMWHMTPFSSLQALPRDAKAVALWSDRDEALMNVAEGIRQIAEELVV